MSTWRTCFRRLWPWKTSDESEKSSLTNASSVSNRFDQYAVFLENVVVWENPLISAACVLSVNIFFWIIFTLERKFYCVLTLILWFILFYNFWNEQMFPFMKMRWRKFAVLGEWCNRNCCTQTSKESCQYYVQIRDLSSKFFCWLMKFRQEYPGLFCVWMISFFVCLTALGQAVPGLLLAYMTSMIVLVGPGLVIHVLPSSVVQRISNFHQFLIQSTSGEHDSEVDEYLPESNKETLAVLSQATDISESSGEGGVDEGLDSLIPENDVNHTNGGDSSSHVSYLDLDLDVTKMPAHDQESLEGSLDAPEEFELSPYEVDGVFNSEHVRKRRKGSAGNRERKNVDVGFVEEDSGEGMRFESMHFEGGDSSSEEEELKAFSRGLSLDRVPQDDHGAIGSEVTGQVGHLLGQFLVQSGAMASVVRSIGSMGALVPPLQRAVGGQQQPPSQSQPKEEENSDEDFEMISEEDLS